MKTKRILLAGALVTAFASCSDFLDTYPYGQFPEEEMWERPSIVQGFVYRAYEFMSKTYNDNEGYYLDGATDDAVITSTTHALTKLGTGSITTSQDPFGDYWSNDYKAIASVNRFLKDNRGFNTRYKTEARKDSITRWRLQGEAYALRAWFQWDLLKRFGGRTDNGELLGFPIVTESFDDEILTGEFNRARDTYEDCMKQIQNDCDSAFKYLPIAHRDFLIQSSDKNEAGGKFWGCLDGITTRAILSQMYLTYASPLFNQSEDRERWKLAAEYAKEVIDFKLNVDGQAKNGFKPMDRVLWTDPNFAGIVFTSRFDASNDAIEKAFYPGGFRGNGSIGATQELVDAFPMSNGYPKEHPEGKKLYDPQNPYKNRDPRFYSIIFYNGAQACRDNNASKPMYTFENWVTDAEGQSGKDLAGLAKNSRTNYHIKKFVYMGLNWSDASVKKSNHSKFYVRWAHMLLNFAEAANEYGGPDAEIDGLTAREAMRMLRQRKTYDNANLYADADPYLDEFTSNDIEGFREFIRNERRIETCFEGMRYYDLRRWSTESDLSLLNMPVTRPVITKNADGTFTYGEPEVVEVRKFTSPYQPIPYNEMRKMDKLVQNKGWDQWK